MEILKRVESTFTCILDSRLKDKTTTWKPEVRRIAIRALKFYQIKKTIKINQSMKFNWKVRKEVKVKNRPIVTSLIMLGAALR